jgi:hypothetical protein
MTESSFGSNFGDADGDERKDLFIFFNIRGLVILILILRHFFVVFFLLHVQGRVLVNIQGWGAVVQNSNVFVHVSASSDGSYLVKAADWQVLADALSEVEAAKGVRLKVQVDPGRV